MKNQKTILTVVLTLAFVACSGGGSTSSPPAAPPPTSGPSPADVLAAELEGLPLGDFYDVSFAALLKRTPETVVWQGLTSFVTLESAGLNVLTDRYQRDTFAMAEVALDALGGYDRSALSDAEKLEYDTYQWYLEDTVADLDFIYYGFPGTFSLFGVPRSTELFFVDGHPLGSLQDAEDYITRLNAVERKFSELVDHLNLQRQNGIVEPGVTLQIALNEAQSAANRNTSTNVYYTSLRDGIADIAGLTSAQRADLEARAFAAVDGPVRRGYERLASALQDLSNNAPSSIGVGQYSRGDAYYSNRLRHHTTTSLSASEIHQLGLDEVARVRAEMRLIFDQLGYPQGETLAQLFARVSSDSGLVPPAQVLDEYEAIIDDARTRLPDAFDIFPAADVIVLPDPFGGFYVGPSLDGTRPGAFYAGTSNFEPRYQMRSLAYHEALPGHHTQIAIAMELDGPVFRKLMRFTGFVEGWALYAERLASELGWYESDPYGELGRLQYEALRAARLVIDTGIHSLGWSFDEAVQYNVDNVGWSVSRSQGAVARYSVIPGQATAYMVGLLEILRERQRAMDVLGDDFDLTAFHRAMLENGAVPLTSVADVVDRYIADRQDAP